MLRNNPEIKIKYDLRFNHPAVLEHFKVTRKDRQYQFFKEKSLSVLLYQDDFRIACEISVTNTVEYEVRNIEKCLTADYLLVFMISNDPVHLSEIREMTVSVVYQALHHRLYFVSKDEFVNQLDLLLAQKSQPSEVRAKGYRVKINYAGAGNTEGQQKVLKDVILSSIRRKDKGED